MLAARSELNASNKIIELVWSQFTQWNQPQIESLLTVDVGLLVRRQPVRQIRSSPALLHVRVLVRCCFEQPVEFVKIFLKWRERTRAQFTNTEAPARVSLKSERVVYSNLESLLIMIAGYLWKERNSQIKCIKACTAWWMASKQRTEY